MDRNFYDNDFEDFLKQKADQHKMYPSDRVWNNIYSSLHGRRKWFGLGFIVLFIGAGLLTGKEMVLHNYNKITSQFNDGDETSAPTPDTKAENKAANTNKILAPVVNINSLRNRPAGVLQQKPDSKNIADLIQPESANNNSENKSIAIPENESLMIENNPLPAVVTENKTSSVDLHTSVTIPEKQLTLPENTAGKAKADVIKEENVQPLAQNENAAVKKISTKPPRWSYQLFASPMISYRKLSNMDQTAGNIPVSASYAGNINQYVHHKPAVGFEVGGKLLFQVSNSLSLYGGAQINYSRYYIDAYKYHTEKASIALDNSHAPDTVSGYTDIRNFNGYAPEQLQNQYLQLSIPLGIQIKLIGSKRLQLNVAGGIQPTFMLSNSTYLISSDYKNYIQSPDLARTFNVHTNFEAFISYKTGSIKWQLGPQFRSQLLSSYSNQYRVREYLTEYGIKLGITKSF